MSGKKKNKIFKKIIRWIIKHKIASIVIGVIVLAGIITAITFAVTSSDDKIDSIKSDKNIAKKDGPAESFEEERITDPPVDSNYLIKVNRALNCVTVYEKTGKGEYNNPIKAFVCSTGRPGGHETPLGEFSISWKSEWCLMVDGTYGQYTSRFNGDILFHSVPYFGTVPKDKTNLEYEQYNKLGDFASLGCVRLCVADAKWIYNNCPNGTKVIVYDDYSSPGPLGKPGSYKLPFNDKQLGSALGQTNLLRYCGWDPTDPDGNNPWRHFTINPSTVKVTVGTSIEKALDQVQAFSPDWKKVPGAYLKVASGTVDLNTPGTYNVKVEFNKGVLPASGEADVTIVVTNEVPTENKTSKETTTQQETSSTKPEIKPSLYVVNNPIKILAGPGAKDDLLNNYVKSNLKREDYPGKDFELDIVGNSDLDFTMPGTYTVKIGYKDDEIAKEPGNEAITVQFTLTKN